MFFVSWEMQYDENSRSYEQLVIGSFIKIISAHSRAMSYAVFWWNIKSPRRLSPCTAQIWYLVTLAFPKTKITFEREEISECRWDSGKYDGAADGNSNKGFCRVFWKVEENAGRTVWGPKVPTLTEVSLYLCMMFLVSSINVSFILYSWVLSGQTSYFMPSYFKISFSLFS